MSLMDFKIVSEITMYFLFQYVLYNFIASIYSTFLTSYAHVSKLLYTCIKIDTYAHPRSMFIRELVISFIYHYLSQ